ncbi:hypothetical protein ZIOFF_017604 [Zingiber officinale]|uniref:Uncharacterized protein n=1 Tax=Zingiber officinale TaxID=94328 RepID=A0A8J5HNX6_ZINOF|nr:hypothetical protein ZIOFF_017604 [Zingiber officinale]
MDPRCFRSPLRPRNPKPEHLPGRRCRNAASPSSSSLYIRLSVQIPSPDVVESRSGLRRKRVQCADQRDGGH